jgi:uncharacterized protein (TIGR02391 family)
MRELEFPGDPADYRRCSPCEGNGYYGLAQTATCRECRGYGIVPKRALRVEIPGVPRKEDPDARSATHFFHAEVERVSGPLLRDRHYRNAALDAYIRVIEEVKSRSGRADLDGDDLMNQAFGCDKKTPALKFNELTTDSDRNEQNGMMFLFKGLVRLRNSKAHRVDVFNDPQRAYEYLALASLLMRLLETAVKTDAAPTA